MDCSLLFILVTSILYVSYKTYNIINFGFGGIDIWRWIKYSLIIKEKRKIPKFIEGYLIQAPFNYPPVFLILLSFFPERVIRVFPHIIQLVLMLIDVLLVYIFFHVNGLNTALVIFYLVLSFIKNRYFSSRSLPNLLITLFFITINLDIHIFLKIFFLSAIFITFFYSHRHSVQFLFFFLIFYSFFNFSYLILFICLFGVLLIYSPLYRNIFKNHISILNYHRLAILNSGHYFKNFLVTIFKVITSKIYYFIPFIIFFHEGDTLDPNTYFLFFALLLSFLYSLNRFSFLGEPNRNFDYMNFILIIILAQLPYVISVIVVVLGGLVEIAKYFFKRKKDIYDVNIKLDPEVVHLLRNYDGFSFMSFPPIFDDFILYKFPQSRVLFHDNGVAINLNPWAYMSNFQRIISDAQLIEINSRIGFLDFIIVSNDEVYKQYKSLKSYEILYQNNDILLFRKIDLP